MKIYEVLNSLNALDEEIDFVRESIHSYVMSDAERNQALDKYEQLSNLYQEMLNSDVEYTLPTALKTEVKINVENMTEEGIRGLVDAINQYKKKGIC